MRLVYLSRSFCKEWPFFLFSFLIGCPAFAAEPVVTVTRGTPQIDIGTKVQAVQETRRIPGGTDFIDQTQWQGNRAATVKDIVDYSPGVFAQPRNGAESSRLSIRGSGLTRTFQGRGLLILQDGIPINTADGGFEFPVIDPWLIDHATILRGANALTEGASNFGGAISLTSPTGLTQPGYEARGEIGSFGERHALLSKGLASGDVDAFAAISGFKQNGFRDNNRQETTRFNGNIGWRSNPFLIQRLSISQTTANPQIPGAVSQAEIDDDPRQANPVNIRGRFRRDTAYTRIGHRAAWESGPRRVESTLYYAYRTLDNPVTTYIRENNNDVGWRGKYRRDFGSNQLIAGINAAYGTADEDRYANVFGTEGADILNRDLGAATLEAYGQYEHQLLPALFGIAGTQVSYATRDIDQSFPFKTTQEKHYQGFNPRLGLRYDLNRQTQIFTNLSRSFEPPTLDELSGGNTPGFNDLKAQRATTAEIGTRTTRWNMAWDLAYYHGWVRDEFVNYQFANGTTDTINADKSTRDGIELGMRGILASNIATPRDKIELRNTYTYSRFRLDNDPQYNNNQLPGVPEHYLRSEIAYRHPSGLSLAPNIEYVPDGYPIDLTNSLYTKPYAVYGLTAAWQHPSRDVNFYIEGRNLANRAYTATTNVVPNANGNDGRFFYPGEGRAVFIGFKTAF